MTDPDVQRAADEARRALVHRIKPYMPEDTAETVAREFVAALLDKRWRPPLPQPDPYRHGGRPVPGRDVAERGVEQARQALRRSDR